MENALDFDKTLNRKYKFLHCGKCDGLILGQRADKYRQPNRLGYENIVVKEFEKSLRQKMDLAR